MPCVLCHAQPTHLEALASTPSSSTLAPACSGPLFDQFVKESGLQVVRVWELMFGVVRLCHGHPTRIKR